MISAIIQIIKDIFWLIVRGKKIKDANAPQQTLDTARTDAATGNDAALNGDLDAAADRLRHPPSNSAGD